jgi:type II secretory pathway pseudopilin PulG
MAALLVAIAVMAVVMTALLPTWRFQAKRDKEGELIWRGEQYARAIQLFQRKNPGRFPMNVEALIDGRFLRKKYKDPFTGEEFQPIFGSQTPGTGGAPAPGGGGIVGFVSKTKESSIRVYRGATSYDQFRYVYVPYGARGGVPGAVPGPGGGRNPGPGGRNPGGTGPGGRNPGGTGPGRGLPAPGIIKR